MLRSVSDRDMGFLTDRYNFGNHLRLAVAKSLMETLNNPSSPARGFLPDGRALALLTARMFNEYMGSIEDLAALVHAVKLRSPNGIMYEYTEYMSSEVGDVYATTTQWTQAPSLADLLDITPDEVARLRAGHAAAGDDPDAVFDWLDRIPGELQRLGQTYLANFDPAMLGTASVPAVDSKGRPLRSMQAAHNKIKHGSLVVEDAAEIVTLSENAPLPNDPRFRGKLLVIVKASDAGQSLEPLLASYPVTPPHVKGMYDTVESIANMANAITGTCAALIRESIWSY